MVPSHASLTPTACAGNPSTDRPTPSVPTGRHRPTARKSSALAAVRACLAGLWRASRFGEGINSVLRMQQSRHRRMTQGLLDLKRLYWNCHEFRTGKRKKETPYRRLGVPLPPLSWWEMLKLSPETLRQLLPSPPLAQPLQKLSPQDVVA